MARVTATRPITRRVAGVGFVDGQAETDDPGALAYFRRRPGYEVEDAPQAKPAPARRSSRKPARKPRSKPADTDGQDDGDQGDTDGQDDDQDGGE